MHLSHKKSQKSGQKMISSIFSLQKWATVMTLQNHQHSFVLRKTRVFRLHVKNTRDWSKMNWTAGNFSVGTIKFQFHHKTWRHKVTLPICHLQRCLPLCFGVTLKNTREGKFSHYCSWLGRRKKGKVKQVFTLKLLLSPKGLRVGTSSLKMLISYFITLFTIKIKE